MAVVPKILIISSDTGGGHRSAADAIVAGCKNFWQGDSSVVRVMRAIEKSHAVSKKLVRLYNWVLRNRQPWMEYLYWAVNTFRPEKQGVFYKMAVSYVTRKFDRWCPHIVVSVHPLTQHFFARFLKELGLADTIPLVTVVTDPCYGFWKGWACAGVTLYLVASEEARQQLIDYGVAPERIKISGMPVHPKFEPPDERAAQAARLALGLDPEKFTVFVNAGWAGGGNIPEIFRELMRGDLNVQAIFLAGRNDALRVEAESLAAQYPQLPVKVIGYSKQVEQLMQAANVMISKLGGLTTFEALACRLPIIGDAITPPMPQESGTAALITKRGAGVMLERARDIVPTVRRMVDDARYYAALRASAAAVALPHSTRRIVEEITALLPAPAAAQDEPAAAEIRAA